jgi:hypothetical protein
MEAADGTTGYRDKQAREDVISSEQFAIDT